MITERDLEIVRFVARFSWVTTEQVRQWISGVDGGSAAMRVTNRRLAELLERGLLLDDRILSEHGRVVWASREGLSSVDVEGGHVHPPRISQARHDKMVTDLALNLMITKPTHTLVTEREMRRADTPHDAAPDAPMYVTVQPGIRARRVYPDLLTIAPSGARVVHEIETTAKAHGRLVTLALSHLTNDAVGAVRYYAPREVAGVIEKSLNEARQTASERGILKPLNLIPWETLTP